MKLFVILMSHTIHSVIDKSRYKAAIQIVYRCFFGKCSGKRISNDPITHTSPLIYLLKQKIYLTLLTRPSLFQWVFYVLFQS